MSSFRSDRYPKTVLPILKTVLLLDNVNECPFFSLKKEEIMQCASGSGDGWVISQSEENFETWISRKSLSDGLREQLRKADILAVPIEGRGNLNIPVFPERTEDLLNFLRRELPKDLVIDICIEEDDYKELALYADLVILASFVVTSIALPFLVNLVSNYIYQKISKPKSRNMKISITLVSENGESKNLSYEGPLDGFRSIVETLGNRRES